MKYYGGQRFRYLDTIYQVIALVENKKVWLEDIEGNGMKFSIDLENLEPLPQELQEIV